MKQTGLAGAAPASKRKITRRERFLAVMEQVVPWARLVAAAEPHWPPAGGEAPTGLPPLEGMLRLHFVQQWYGLSDDALDDALHDSETLARFVGIDRAALPAAAERLEFRRLLEGRPPLQAMLDEIDAHLRRQGLVVKRGSIIEAAIAAA